MTDDARSSCQQTRDLIQGALPYWQPLWEARSEERAFLDGERYQNDHGAYNRDRRRQQFRGQQISNVGRNQAAQATATPRSIEALPVDRHTDPEDAEIAVSVLEWELSHPQKGFDDTLEEVIQDAMDARAGCALLKFDPDLGEYGGETFWHWKDPNLVMFEPEFSDPHHIDCRWFSYLMRMRVDDLKAMGKLKGKARWNVEGLQGDASAYSRATPDETLSSTCERAGVPGDAIDDDHIWIRFCYYKNERDTYKRQKGEQEIPEAERYMGCDNAECGYRSDTQGMLLEQGKLEKGGALPDEMDPCPVCGGHLSRRDIRAEEDEVLLYPKGKRMIVFPALQQLPDDEPCYEGAWPVPSARSFPVLWITRYVKGGRPMGDSDTTRNWDAQLASDQLMTMAFDRITRHQTYYGIPATGITTPGTGKRYEFRDDEYNVFVVNNTDPNRPAPQVQVVEGASLDPAFGPYWDRVQNVLLGQQGTNDFGLTPESSKQIAASTVAQLNQIENIPIQHFIRRKNRALGKAYGVHWDFLRATYTSRRLARLKFGDEFIVDRLRGDDLPNFDFTVSEAPPFTGLEKARGEAFNALLGLVPQAMQLGVQPGALVDLFAKVHQLPPSIGRDFKRMLMAVPQVPGGMGGPPIPPELQGFEPEINPLDQVQMGRENTTPPAAQLAA